MSRATLRTAAALGAIVVATAVAGEIEAMPADPGPRGIADVWTSRYFGGFQSGAVGAESARSGFPHRWTRAELRSMARGVLVIHGRIRAARGLPRANGARCTWTGYAIGCAVTRGGRAIGFYPVARVWEDGSVRVVLPRPVGREED